MSSEIKPLTRLAGTETEHAIHFAGAKIPCYRLFTLGTTHRNIYDQIVSELTERMPSAPPKESKKGAFLGNGCAVWFEKIYSRNEPGHFEACTPECSGPRQLLASSRGLERLLVNACQARNEKTGEDAKLLKNSTDPRGKYYGLQENFSVEAYAPTCSGWLGWWMGIGVLYVLKVLLLIKILVVLMPMLFGAVLLAAPFKLISMCIPLGAKRKEKWNRFLFGFFADMESPNDKQKVVPSVDEKDSPDSEALPHWCECVFRFTTILISAPYSIAVSLFYRFTKMGKTYEAIKPFLISRIVYSGNGALDENGTFNLSQRAISRNRDWFVALADVDRAILSFNGIHKAVFTGDIATLKMRHQRMSLAAADPNMCEVAEYLRIGATTLVLDAVESGAINVYPRLRYLIKALRVFNNDPTLSASVPTSRGEMSAIEIQQFYYNACRRYVDGLTEPCEEAEEILSLWNQVLCKLKQDPEQLFGSVDWITKRALMRDVMELSEDKPISDENKNTVREFSKVKNRNALQKINLKYHELSDEGYYYQLSNAGLTRHILEPVAVERALRMPPLDRVASTRARYIREFSGDIEWATWNQLKIQSGKVINFRNEIDKSLPKQ